MKEVRCENCGSKMNYFERRCEACGQIVRYRALTYPQFDPIPPYERGTPENYKAVEVGRAVRPSRPAVSVDSLSGKDRHSLWRD